MREKIAPREFWNRRSQHYDEQSGAAYADAYRKTAERIRPYLTPNDRVLDFACGTGLVTLPVAQMAADAYAHAIYPTHTTNDGDAVFVMATGEVEAPVDVVGVLATRALERAIVDSCDR